MALETSASFRERAHSSVRFLLRSATAAAHERMHAHTGFNAAAAGTIGVQDYRRLLSRLLGFHRPFEGQIRSAADRCDVDLDCVSRARSPLLVADLLTLGVSRGAVDNLPDWAPLFDLASEAAVLGSLYVLEGSNSRRRPDCACAEGTIRSATILSGRRRTARSVMGGIRRAPRNVSRAPKGLRRRCRRCSRHIPRVRKMDGRMDDRTRPMNSSVTSSQFAA